MNPQSVLFEFKLADWGSILISGSKKVDARLSSGRSSRGGLIWQKQKHNMSVRIVVLPQ